MSYDYNNKSYNIISCIKKLKQFQNLLPRESSAKLKALGSDPLLRKGQTATVMEAIKMHMKPSISQVMNGDSGIDKTSGDKHTTEFRKYKE